MKWAGGGSARRQLHALRREAILQEAARCFNRKGYRGTTIDDIARQLNVSKAALYYYVKDKEALLVQCHRMSLDIGMEALRLAGKSGGPADAQLRLALRYYLEHVTGALKGCVAVLEEGVLSPKRHAGIVQQRDEYERRIRRVIAEGIESKVFVRCDPKIVVLAMLGAVNWIPRWFRVDGGRPPKEIARIFSAYLVRGLQSRPDDIAELE